MQNKTKTKRLIILAVISIAVAALFFPVITVAELVQTPAPTDNFGDYFKANVLSLAALLGAMAAILAIIGKVFKPVREWFIRWMRKSLRIVDANKTINERFEATEQRVAIDAETRKKEYAVMSGQNNSIEMTLDKVLKSVGDISRRMGTLEESNIALIRDGITKTFYKYCHQEAIPVHEKENMGKMFDIYRKYNANSYVGSLMKICDGWDVIFGDESPSCNVPHS